MDITGYSCHSSWAHGPILSLLCVCVCAGVCVWVCLIEADSLQLRIIYRGFIRSCHAVLCCQILRLSACVMVSGFRPFLLPAPMIPDLCRFLDSEHRTLGCPLLPCATCPNLRRAQRCFLSVTCLTCFNKPFLFPLLESSSLYS